MSGHSKWASIKHKKGAADAKRGAAFTKMIKEITVAAKSGGGNPESNARLRSAIDRARTINMPKDNISNAIKKGTGELKGVSYEEVTFDAYGPGGVAMLIAGVTDNKNRTTAEIRNILSKKHGSMAGPGSTSFLFIKKGSVIIDKSKTTEEDLMEFVLDAGGEDILSEGDFFEIPCDVENLTVVKEAIEAKEIPIVRAEMTMNPSSDVKVVGTDAKKMIDLMEALDEHEDVQNVYANFDISDEEMEKISQES